MSENAVVVEGLSKRFRLYHERPNSLKERVVRLRRANYEQFWALRDVSVEIARGRTIGLIGSNGSGKSTLLKCIAGILQPDAGTVRTFGRMASLLELGAGFHPELTGRENVYLNASILGLSRRETDAHFDEIVAFSELEQFIDMQVKHYSSGMYVRLGFAVAVHVDPEILLVDEVLAVGDESFQRKCIDRIRSFQSEGRTIVFVTHAVDLVNQICDRAVMLEAGRVADLGRPRDVIRTFRRQMHQDSESAQEAEGGTMEAEITSAAVLDASGAPREVFAPGDPLRLRVDVSPKTSIDEAVVGIGLYDDRDQLVYGTNTLKHGQALAPLERPVRVTFDVPSLPMLDGRFAVTVGVHSPDDLTRYHWLEKKLHFEVRSSGEQAGMVHLAATCSVSDPDHSDRPGG